MVVDALISGGADVRAKAKDGWTALYHAAVNSHSEVVTLIRQAANINAPMTEHGVTSLYQRAMEGRVGQTLLHNAAFNRSKVDGGYCCSIRSPELCNVASQ
jgi:ankyrin repeat protein